MSQSNAAVDIGTLATGIDHTVNRNEIIGGLYFGEKPPNFTDNEVYKGYKRFGDFLEAIYVKKPSEISKEVPIVKSLSELRGRFTNFKKTDYQKEFERCKETVKLLMPVYFPDNPYSVGYMGEEVDILFDR